MDTPAFSKKQLLALKWWRSPETSRYDAIICDGAVRSGKTYALSLGFALWSFARFSNENFALCGKTIGSVRRNILPALTRVLKELGFVIRERASAGYFEAELGGRKNRYWLFGGRDESSAALIQGMTLAGVLLDEVALMPRSFVEQALARCSVPGSKIWFSCNPDRPSHWFYREWICEAEEKNALYLRFCMDDNPALSPAVKARYDRLYSGAFHDRYVKGIWAAARGLVYPMFSPQIHLREPGGEPERYIISCDYGTLNPTSLGLWGLWRGCWYRLAENYYDGRKTARPRTDEEHYSALSDLAGARRIEAVICDPSAASFIACIRRHSRFAVIAANNDVLSGIHRTADALRNGEILISPRCKDTIREFSLYSWDEKASRDAPLKENDHAMDDIRYFVYTVLERPGAGDFYAASLPRRLE